MKTRIIFIVLWLFFIVCLILRLDQVPGSLILSMLASFSLIVIYFGFSRRIVLVPKDQQKLLWLIYLSGIVWGQSLVPIIFIFNGYQGAELLSLVNSIFLIALIVLTSINKSRLSNKTIFVRLILHSAFLLLIIGMSYMFLL